MFIFHVFLSIFLVASAQRYAERNVLPADTFPSSDTTYNEDYDYESYGFDYKEEPDVYKWNVEEFPHPLTTPRFCNRMKASHICDPDRVLEKEQADVLDTYIQKLYHETPCICEACKKGDGGIVVGIALLKHMFHPFNVHPAKVIRSFAEALRFRWKLGRCDNDILIVVATTDRLSYTDVGKATSQYLSIHEAHRIFLENKAKFSAFNFSEGLLDILQGYYKATRVMKSAMAVKDGGFNMGVVAGAIVGSVVLLGIILFVGFVLYRRYRIKKDSDSDDDNEKPDNLDKGASVSSSWSKKDITVLFGPDSRKPPHTTSAKYQKCETDETDTNIGLEEEKFDFTLAMPDDDSFPNDTQLTNVTTDSDTLEKDLSVAAEGIARTFPKTEQKVAMTDM